MDKLISHAKNAKVHAQNLWERAKPRKRYVGIGLVVFIFIIKSLIPTSTTQWGVVNKEIEVTSGTIENSIKVIGNTKITDQQTLTFGQEGTIKKIYVKEGQTVKKWDLLAELDKKTLSNSMAQQSLSIQSARLNYEKLFTSTTEADKIKAKNSVDDAQNQLDVAKQQLANMMLSSGDTLQTKAANIQAVLISTKNSIVNSKKILDDINQIYSITVKINTDDIDRLLSCKNTNYKASVQSAYYTIVSKLSTLEGKISTIQASSSTTVTEMLSVQDTNKSILNDLSSCLNNAKLGLDNSVAAVNLPQSQIDSWTAKINTDSTSVLSSLASLNNESTSLRTTATDIQNKKNEIANDEAQVKMYQDLYQTMVNWPSAADRQLQLNNIKQIQLSLSQLSQQGENYEITAPFDGNVDIVSMKVWDKITANIIADKYITVSNPDIYEIDMLIDQVDIVKINKGQPVEITFDAYPWYITTGSISEINPTPVTNAWVVSYTAKVIMKKWEKKIYDSMTVTVKIITERKTNTLVIPRSAIKTESGTSVVNIITSNGNTKLTPVVPGIKDGSNTEILSGLKLWDKIMIQKYVAARTSAFGGSGSSGIKPPNTKWLGIGWWDPSANHGQRN